jgi:hypothetical protein
MGPSAFISERRKAGIISIPRGFGPGEGDRFLLFLLLF